MNIKYFFKAFSFFSVLFLFLSFFSSADALEEYSNKPINIILFTFPGGKSHLFILRKLIRNVVRQTELFKPYEKIKFHIISHEHDYKLWKESNLTKNYYQLYHFGVDGKSYQERFDNAMRLAREDPVFGYKNFNEAMIHINTEFLESNILKDLKNVNGGFELIIVDVVTMIAPFIRRELNIPKMIFFNPTCIYTWVMPNMEYNAAYEPVIGSPFTDNMSFTQRLINFSIKIGTDIMYNSFINSQNEEFIKRGYAPLDPFQPKSIFLNQCVNGLSYPISLPPNFAQVGSVLPEEPNHLEDTELINWLNAHKTNAYASQGTITKMMNIEQIFNVFSKFPEIGFIFQFRKDNVLPKNVPKNVLLKMWVPQNDLFGDSRLKFIITHGGLNSVYEALYHGKPSIVLGSTIDQVNNAKLVKHRKCGFGFTRLNQINEQSLVEAIKDVLKNEEEYKRNAEEIRNIMKESDSAKEFYQWFNYILYAGYEHLIIPAVLKSPHYELFNFDILGFYLIVLALVSWLIYIMIKGIIVGLIGIIFNKENNKDNTSFKKKSISNAKLERKRNERKQH